VTATLPTGVTFVGNAQTANGAAPAFDTTHRTITWNIGTLPFGTGNGTSPYTATFQVSITPSANQQHTSPTLLTNVSMSGTDPFTQQDVGSSPHDLTTDTVEGHPNQGSVQ